MSISKRMRTAIALATLMASVPASAQMQPARPVGDVVADTTRPGSYVLGPGDRVRVIVFGEDRLSGEYTVTSNGEMSFPLIGNLRVTGLTVADVQVAIHDKLSAGYVKDPRVSAEVLSFRPYYVLGEVARPGQYPYVEGMTLEQAIATAGGFTYRAKRKELKLKPAQAMEAQKVKIKKEAGRSIRPGDTITVEERFF